MIDVLAKLSINAELSNDQVFHIEEFVRLGYSPPKPKILQAAKLRWHLCTKKQRDGKNLPPTHAALKQKVLRAFQHAFSLGQAIFPVQRNLNPSEYGYLQK